MVEMGKECRFPSNFDMPQPFTPHTTELPRKTEFKSPFCYCHFVRVNCKPHRPKEVSVATKTHPCIVLYKATGNPREMCD